MCGWTNAEAKDGLDEINWDRVEAKTEAKMPLVDHTTGTRDGESPSDVTWDKCLLSLPLPIVQITRANLGHIIKCRMAFKTKIVIRARLFRRHDLARTSYTAVLNLIFK